MIGEVKDAIKEINMTRKLKTRSCVVEISPKTPKGDMEPCAAKSGSSRIDPPTNFLKNTSENGNIHQTNSSKYLSGACPRVLTLANY